MFLVNDQGTARARQAADTRLPRSMRLVHLDISDQGPPPVGERPLGCKTIFVGGQPEKMTTEMLKELFLKHGGEIDSIRQGKRNFCHIRFVDERAIDAAMFVSGYRVRIGANIDPDSNGRLRVDFAANRDDQYEYECEQRRRAREARHAVVHEEPTREDLPNPMDTNVTIRYSHPEYNTLLSKIKDGESFPQAANQLVTWLERGELDKRNANNFYNMVQSAHMHVRRLIGEKASCDLELNQVQQTYRMKVVGLITQYTLIEQVLMSACKQKAWDHFTKAQRKNIEGWKKQTKELRQQQQEELGLGEKGEAEMELSDEEDVKPKRTKMESDFSATASIKSEFSEPDDQLQLQVQALMQQNTNLRTQLEEMRAAKEAYASAHPSPLDSTPPPLPPPNQSLAPVPAVETTASAHPVQASSAASLGATPPPPPTPPNEEMEMQIKALQHSLLTMQQQLTETKTKLKKEESQRKEAEEKLSAVEMEKIMSSSSESLASDLKEVKTLDQKKANMIGLLSIFLNVHPFGASTEYLWSYMQRIHPTITLGEIEGLMNSYPNLFRQDLFGVGATLEKRWRYIVLAKFADLKV